MNLSRTSPTMKQSHLDYCRCPGPRSKAADARTQLVCGGDSPSILVARRRSQITSENNRPASFQARSSRSHTFARSVMLSVPTDRSVVGLILGVVDLRRSDVRL